MSEAHTSAWARFARRAGQLVLPMLLAGLILFGVLLLAHRFRTTGPGCFSSDTAYAVEVCQDILGRGYERANWHFPMAPQVFPEAVLLVPCVALFRDLLHAFLAYNLLQHGLFVLILAALFRHAGLGRREAFRLAAAGELALLAALLDPSCWAWVPAVFVPACHTGAVLAGLLLWLLAVRGLHRPARWWEAALFVTVGGAAVFSDRLVLAQFLAPLALTALALGAFRAMPWRKALGICALAGGACGCWLAITAALRRCPVVLLSLDGTGKPSQMLPALQALVRDLPAHLRGQYVVICALLALLLLATSAGLYQALRARRARSGAPASADPPAGAAPYRPAAAALPAVAAVACLCAPAALVLSGVGARETALRYLLADLFLPFLFLGLCLRLLPGAPSALLGRLVPLAAVLLAGWEFSRAEAVGRLRLGELCQPYSDEARTLDRLAREGKIGRGLATYWNARRLEYETRAHVPIRTAHAHGEPWLHLQNPNAYLAPGRGRLEVPRYNFLLFDPRPPFPMRAEELCRHFGSPREKVLCGPFEVWIYDGLVSNQLTRYLRSALAYRCRTQLPWRGPAAPPRLSRPARNFAPFSGKGVLSLPPDGEVTVSFAAPVHGELLDLGAPFDGHYEITFRRGPEELGRVYAPRANFEAVSGGYQATGNQSRLLTVPPAARARGWTSATVRAAAAPGTFALRHFLVYEAAGRKISARQMAPGGRWRFEAEHQPGGYRGADAVVADPRASEGKARFAPAAFSGPLVHGPLLDLEPGRYRVEFYVRSGPGGGTAGVGSADVVSECGRQLHARRELRASELAGQAGYRKVALEFEADVDVSDCEFRVLSAGKAPLYVDRVELECLR